MHEGNNRSLGLFEDLDTSNVASRIDHVKMKSVLIRLQHRQCAGILKISGSDNFGCVRPHQFLSLNWPRWMRTSRPPKSSATGATGWCKATASEADELGTA